MSQPRSHRSSTRSPRRAVSASAIDVRCCGRTCAEPPPMIWVRTAFGPMTASVRGSSENGSTPSFSRSTNDAAAASRASARSAALSGTGVAPASIPPIRANVPSSRVAWSSSTCSSTVPSRTALARAGPKKRAGPGISRSRPASAEPAVEPVANQSVSTKPSKPQSPRRISVTSSRCSAQNVPLSRLYAVITPSAPPSRTASSNGTR